MYGSQDAVSTLQGTSLEAFLSSLVVNFVVFCVFIILFIILRTKLHRIYEPRAYIEYLRDERRMPKLSRKPWGWIMPLARIYTHKEFIMEKSGLDAYFFIRFLRMILIIFVPALIIVWPILLPINIIDGVNDNPSVGQANVNGLDRLAFGNVSRRHVGRYWAHLIMAYLFVIWICVVTFYEMIHYVKTRQQWLTSKRHQKKAAASTILITTIPKPYLDENKLRELFSVLPGGVKNVWLNRDCSRLLDECNARDAIAQKLETAELDLIKRARNNVRKQALPSYTTQDEDKLNDSSARKAHEYVSQNDRPHHRLPLFSWFISLPNWLYVGRKVDTIDWCKQELAHRNPEIESKQKNPSQYRSMNSAFVQFNKQLAAHMAVQCISHHTIKAMHPRHLEISPRDVLWRNMQMHWWERYMWVTGVWAAVIALTIFYAVPTAFIGSLSHVTELVHLLPWLGFLNTDRPGAKFWAGLVTGVLPPALLGLILLLIPLLMKFLARLQGHPTRKVISLIVQDMYFFFLFIQLFLVITISSGITSLINNAINNPTGIPQLLATSLPKAANFFFAYMLLQGLSSSSGDLLQWWWILVHYVATWLTSTPRSKWKRWNNMRTNTWGTTYPQFTVLAVIGIIYSVIAPLIMIFVIIAFVLIGISQLNNFMYVYDPVTDTGGLSFPKAIQQIFVGIYFLELSLTGLFFLVRKEDGTGVPCKVQAILMIILLILTIVFQILFYHNFHPLVNYLPLDTSLADTTDASPLLPQSPSNREALTRFSTKNSTVKNNQHENDYPDLESSDTGSAAPHEPALLESEHNALLQEAFKHEALRRRTPIIWLPADELGIAADEVLHMPDTVPASTAGARLNERGEAEYTHGESPPDYVASDDILL